MTLTKKHFKAIAEIINNCLIYDEQGQKAYNHRQIENLLGSLSNYFKAENPLFDRSKFEEVCLK